MMPLNAGLRKNAFSSDGPRTTAIATMIARNSAMRSTNRCGPRMLRRSVRTGSPSVTATGRRRRIFRDGNDNLVEMCDRRPGQAAPVDREKYRDRHAIQPGQDAMAGRPQRLSRASLRTVWTARAAKLPQTYGTYPTGGDGDTENCAT